MKPLCNIHVHTFNAFYVPDKFLGLYVPDWLAKILTKLLRRKAPAKVIVWALKKFGGPTYSKFAAFLRIGIKNTQDMVFNDLRKQGYPENARFVVLPLNFKHMGAGKVNMTYEQQLEGLMEVKRRFPNQCLPFVFIDPRMGTVRENKDFVEKYMAKGFVGIKMYPSLGYYPFDERLEEVYAFAEKNEVPILTHCSTTGVYYKDEKHIPDEFLNPKSFNKLEKEYFNVDNPRSYKYVKNQKLDKFTDNFLRPEVYTDALTKFPKLKICFAHFGLDNEQANLPMEKWIWFKQVIQLMRDFENVYADISYSLHHKPFLDEFVKLTGGDELVQKKVLFGTDYFMTLQEAPEKTLYHQAVSGFGDNMFEKIAVENVGRYLSSGFYRY